MTLRAYLTRSTANVVISGVTVVRKAFVCCPNSGEVDMFLSRFRFEDLPQPFVVTRDITSGKNQQQSEHYID